MNFIVLASLFLQLANPYETRIFVNLEGGFIVYARYYQGNLISVDSVVPMPRYLSDRFQARNKNLLLEELKKDWLKQGGSYATQGLIGTFEIPLPKGGFSEFMGETGKLDVGGYVKITLGGSKTIFNSTSTIDEQGQTWLPELQMKQEMAINLDGQVGDRIKVFIDHNSERIDESQNKITITYKGREDEILQEIEGGDTQLSIPATTYTGDIPSHRGLFGVKSSAKLGPLDIVGIASKEQTQAQEMVIEGTVHADTGRIWDRDFEKRRFFWIGTYDTIITGSLQIYVDDNNASNNQDNLTYPGIAYETKYNDTPDSSRDTIPGFFTFKSPGDYYQFVPGSNIVKLNSSLYLDQDMLAICYKKIVNGQTITVGVPPESLGARVRLKLICPRRPDSTSITWQYEQKNYYQIVAPGSRLDSLRIYWIPTGSEVQDYDNNNLPLIQVMNLDVSPQDGMVDEYRVYDPNQGLLIFPEPLPFASTNLPVTDSGIYYNSSGYQGDPKYYLYKKTIEAKPIYDLPANTQKVSVWVDDIPQDSSSDFHVDYDQGKLEFKKVIPPTSKVRIKVEYSPMFSLSQKSLVGMRASMKTIGDGTLGTSFFYRTESYLAEHPRLTEEPFNRMVLETDFALPESLPFLTKMVDWLPLVSTEAQSRLNLNFEGAYSFSNLNSQGQAYLDDLESSTILSNEIQVNRTAWVPCAKPLGRDTANFTRTKLIWYNPIDKERLYARDIYDTTPDPEEVAEVMKLIYRPDSLRSYAGLTQYIYGEDLSECEKLELIVKGHQGRLHVDVCQEVSEDQLRRNRQGRIVGLDTLNDEDQLPPKGTWYEQNEDTGLDGVYGADSSNVAGDDGNDDYRANDYTGGINGTEGNRVWDTEDIDRNGILNTENKFYSYSVHLDSAEWLVANSGLKPSWNMFRIPLKDSLAPDTATTVKPDWRNIKYVRIWFDEFSQAETLLIYKINFTGSRWKNYGVRSDSVPLPDTSEHFTMTPVNTKDNPYYKSPYPLTKDMYGNYKTEGGLELKLDNIRRGHYCVAYRRTEQAEDYRGYDTLSFYFNAPNSNPEITFRLGSDSLNFYEFKTVYNDAGVLSYNGYRLYKVPFQRFLTLKNRKRESGASTGDTMTEGRYTVAGNPSLAGNQFFEIRLRNPSDIPLSDEIWFNDIKAVGPKREVGRIVRGSGSLNFADLTSVNFSFNESNGRFKRLSESKDLSSQSSGRSYSVSGSLALDKFLPADWHFSIPLGVNYNNSANEPRFWYNANDLEVAPVDYDVMRDRSRSNSYTIQFSKSNSKNWFLKQTLDRLSLSHDQSRSFNRAAQNCDTSRTINYNGSYALDPKVNVKFLKQNFSLLPSANFSANYAFNEISSYNRAEITQEWRRFYQRRRSINPSVSLNYSPHSILNSNFQFAETRDARSPIRINRFGEEVGRNQSLAASLQKNLLVVSPVLTYASGYTEDHRFEIRQSDDYRNISNTSRYGLNSGVDVRKMVRFLTGLRDEKNDSLLVPGSPGWILKEIDHFVEYLQNPTLSYARQRNSSYLEVLTRPDLKYQFGLVDTIPRAQYALTSYPGRSVSDNYGINSGINFRIISLQGGFTGQVSKTLLNSGQISRNVSQTYPNVNLHIAQLEGLPFLKKLTHSSSLNTAFNQDITQSFTDTTLQSDSRTRSFNPLASWQANWIKGIATTADINYSETRTNQYLGGAVNTSRTLSRGGSLSAGYSFSAPTGVKLPFMRNFKFASNMSFNIAMNYTRTTSYGQDPTLPTADNSTLGSNLGLSYNFSASITGGANFDYAENKDINNPNASSKRIGLNLWANINF
jgi:hypothetical protein